MDESFEKLKKDGQNGVDNLVQWMKDSKIIDERKESEERARRLFTNVKDQKNVELEEFKEVIGKLAEEEHKPVNQYTNMLSKAVPKLMGALKTAATAAIQKVLLNTAAKTALRQDSSHAGPTTTHQKDLSHSEATTTHQNDLSHSEAATTHQEVLSDSEAATSHQEDLSDSEAATSHQEDLSDSEATTAHEEVSEADSH